jgi:hypothetical protein
MDLPGLQRLNILYVPTLVYTYTDESPAFIKHFSPTHAFVPFNLLKEITHRVDYPGYIYLSANFPKGLPAFLNEKHPTGVLEMTNALFAQFYNAAKNHIKVHGGLDTMNSMRILIKAELSEIPIYSVKRLDGSTMALLPGGLQTLPEGISF